MRTTRSLTTALAVLAVIVMSLGAAPVASAAEGPAVIVADSSVGYSESGSWATSTGVLGHDGSSTRYGYTSGASATWNAGALSGNYRVEIWVPVHPTSDPAAAVVVTHAAGQTSTILNYTTGASRWVDLGVFPFIADQSAAVTNTRSSGYARTDAVRFSPVEIAPTASLEQPAVGQAASVDGTLIVRFATMMRPSTLIGANFVLQDSESGEIPVAVEVLDEGLAVELTPQRPLAPAAPYTLEIATAVTDWEDDSITGDRSFSFTTEPADASAPTVTLMAPATDGELIPAGTDVVLRFDEPIASETLTSGTVVLIDRSTDAAVAYVGDLADDGVVYRIDPAANLGFSTTFDVTLTSGITDVAGNALVPTTFSFTTSTPTNPVDEFHVAPSGDDAHPGTQAQPFATLERAQDAVASINANLSGPITIYVHDGTYALDEPLTFGAADSGSNGFEVVYASAEGAEPVLSGGVPVSGWIQLPDTDLWTAPAPAADFRQLYVDGERAVRAHSENLVSGVEFTADGDGLVVDESVVGNWANADSMELVWSRAWRHHRLPVESIVAGPTSGTYVIRMAQPYFDWARTSGFIAHGPSPFGFRIENAIELLDQPGEWYLDKSSEQVYYLPIAGQDMTTAATIAPRLDTLVTISGTDLANPVHDLAFEGLTFAYGAWELPSEQGLSTIQGDIFATGIGQTGGAHGGTRVAGNVVVASSNGIRFEGNTWQHLGSAGLRLENGASSTQIIGNTFTDISASAVSIGDMADAYPTDARQVNGDVNVSNNVIYDVAVEYWGSPAVFALYVPGLTVAHNLIYDIPYSGISVGWGWGAHNDSTVPRDNLIANNLVHHHMYGLHDGGGIYTLGRQLNSEITQNVIHDQYNLYGAVYLDAGSEEFAVHENVTYDVPESLTVNGPDGLNDISGNYFDVAPGDSGFPAAIADAAGVEAPYAHLLVGLPAPKERPQDEDDPGELVRTDYATIVPGRAGYTETGEWATSGLTGYDGYSQTRYGVSASASAEWRPDLFEGRYRVTFFNLVHPSSDPAAELVVTSLAGEDVRTIDQTVGSTGWVDLGEFDFGEGTDGFVTLNRMTAPPGNSSGFPRADAVRFEWVGEIPPAPAPPALSHDNGHDTGLHDGDYTVTADIWWGENATEYLLYENGVLIDTQQLTPATPSAQRAATEVVGRANGTYIYEAVFSNGPSTATTSSPLVIEVTDASPGVPVLSHDNWDRDAAYAVTANLWWGTNATRVDFYENGVLIESQALVSATPAAQSAVLRIEGRAPGVYEYQVELSNSAGTTSSRLIRVTVDA